MSSKDKLHFKKQKSQLKPPKPVEPPKGERRFRFEVTPAQAFLRTFGLVLLMIWMFGLGVFVGRGVPVVDPADDTIQAHFLRFLGLGKSPPPLREDAAQTWEDPEDMLADLHYHEELTHEARPDIPLPPDPDEVPEEPESRPSPDEPGDSADSREPSPPGEEEEEPPSEDDSGSFTVAVASMRTPSYAEDLAAHLQAQGYSPRVEVVSDATGRPWHRVMLGPFQSREEASKIMVEINRRENLESIVIKND